MKYVFGLLSLVVVLAILSSVMKTQLQRRLDRRRHAAAVAREPGGTALRGPRRLALPAPSLPIRTR